MNRVMGGNLPARLWREVMLQAHENRTPHPLPMQAAQVVAALPSPVRDDRPAPARAPLLPARPIEPELFERMAEPPPAGTAEPQSDDGRRQMNGLLRELGLAQQRQPSQTP